MSFVPAVPSAGTPRVEFSELGVPADLTRALAAEGIEAPFPIQSAVVPHALAGHDLTGRAPTGSGKTIAFGIPLVARITKAQPHRPTGLVLVPTRELATQVQRALVPMARARRLFVAAVYGGASAHRQVEALRRGASIVVATPGRLADLVEQRHVDLSHVEVVVVDEADRMADMGFLPQVRRLLDRTPVTRQTLLLSATLDGDVDALVQRYQRSPRVIDVTPASEPSRTEHRFWQVDKAAKVGVAARLMSSHERAVVFCRTRHGADRVAKQLGAAGVGAVVVHGSRSQAQRERALDSFRRGHVRALVATDVAARGIHVDDVGLVVHWDVPDDPKDYVHRSGRTGRAGADGVVVSLVDVVDRKKLSALRKALDVDVRFTAPADHADHAAGFSPLPSTSTSQSSDTTTAVREWAPRPAASASRRNERSPRGRGRSSSTTTARRAPRGR